MLERSRIEVRNLWLVACFLIPLLRDFEFWEYKSEWKEYKERAESLTRAMCIRGSINTTSNERFISSTATGLSAKEYSDLSDFIITAAAVHVSRKRKFSLVDSVANTVVSVLLEDEVARYKSLSLLCSLTTISS